MTSPAPTQPLDSVRAFPTPEHIAFQFRLAGPTARALAWLLDLLCRIGVFVACAIPLGMLGAHFKSAAAIGMALFLWFMLDWFSGALCEWLWNGQTPGKRALGIKVIGVDGLPAGGGACFLRNVLRWADGLPFIPLGGALPCPTFAIGLVAMVWSGGFQRLGDYAAGTLVVYTGTRVAPRPIIAKESEVAALSAQLPPELVASVDGASARALSGYNARRRQFHPQRRAEMAEHLAGPLRRRFGLRDSVDADALLCAVHLALFPPPPAPAPGTGRRTRQQPALPTAMGGRAAAMLARRRADWARLEALLGGSVAATAGTAAELSRLYRGACADLALADAYHLPAANVAYLHALVAHAHLRFYRRLGVSLAAIRRTVFERVPATLYGDPCLRIALLAFFGTFVAAAVLGLLRPDLAVTFMGENAANDLRDMYAEAAEGRSTDTGAAMGGFYIFNNVGISLACFASGIFAGVGSLVWLVFNGLYLGLCFGWMGGADQDTSRHFFTFVTAHGPFELTGIALSGAAGLRLGLGLVVNRGLPRLESLRRSAAAAVPIMAVAAALVAAAAPIEAFVSPSALPVAAKRALGAVCAALLVFYLVGLGARGRRLGLAAAADPA